MKKAIILLTILLLIIGNTFARKKILPRPQFLGSKIVNFKTEKDVIWITESEGAFRKIMFKVKDNTVVIHKLIITYGNGSKDVIPVKWIFKQGDWSRIIDLKGKRRVIRKITFYYKSVGPLINGRAEIKVFGIH
ncbi:MAG: hypothetical protein KAT05_00560 [Spirochaetes bacterium]|nr:hypothetical protein [Spirochaetota bacterium]